MENWNNSVPMLKGTTVGVLRPSEGKEDAMGEPTIAWDSETVDNVLATPGGSEDLGIERPDGVSIDMTFHFPKTYGGSLRGCLISYAGNTYRVVGDPQPYMAENTPGAWNRPVPAEVVYG